MRLIPFIILFFFATQIFGDSFLEKVQKPHELKRVNKNLIKDPILKTGDEWKYYLRWAYIPTKAFFDPTVSHKKDNSGSIKLSFIKKVDLKEPIKVKIGKTYTFSVYSKTNSWPPPNLYLAIRYAGGDTFAWSRSSNSKIGQWQENTIFFTPLKNDKIIPYLYIPDKIDGVDNDIWVDDIYLGEGKSFNEPPGEKIGFNGKLVRVDALGNIEVKKNGKFEPFFPMCIYADNRRKDFSIYKKQGFNCNMWAGIFSAVKKGKEAGLFSSFDISAHVIGAGWEGVDSKDINVRAMNLKKLIKRFEKEKLTDSILFYYYDNEMWKEWKNLKKIVNAVKSTDKDAKNRRLHPIYMLNGNPAVARKYSNNIVNFMDLTGAYVGAGWGAVGDGDVSSLEILDNYPDQNSPAVIAQMQASIGKSFRPILFASIAKGAKGMGFWRDFYKKDTPDPRRIRVEDSLWWDDLPNIKKEIDMMMPLIRQPHWTKWKATTDDNKIVIGTRELNDNGYLILANLSPKKKTITIKLNNLPYNAKKIQDYFTKKEVSKVNNNSFKISLKPHDTGVYKLLK